MLTGNLVIAGAHPDDLIGSAGLAFLLKDRFRIHVFDLTRGERGLAAHGVSSEACARIRVAEELKAVALLDGEAHFLGEVDASAYAGKAVCERTAALFTELNPHAVITHWPLDVHPDHVICFAVVLKALQLAELEPEVYFFEETFQSKSFAPDCLVDITPVFDKKVELIRTYACQNENDALVTHKTLDAKFRGSRSGVKYAEAYARWFPENPRWNRKTIFDDLTLP